jgi:hypothetical protein
MEDTVLESEHEKRQQEIQNFRPPQVRPGRIVRWFKEGDRSIEGYIAYVKSVGQRAVKMRILNDDTPWDTNCHHIDDPELKYRPALAKNSGGWDFTPYDKEQEEKLAALEKMIESKERMHSERLAAVAKRLETLEKDLGVKGKS